MTADSKRRSSARKLRGYAVHVYTASGIIFAFLATTEIVAETCDPRIVFGWLVAAVFIDATDGPLARRFDVRRVAASIDGRTVDDLLDYLTFAFIPLMLLDRMQWLPAGWGWTVPLAMGASLLGFAHVNAKFDDAGFFRGFPSYWNIFVFYAGWISTTLDPMITAVLLVVLTIMTVSPIRMIYPNRAPGRWRMPILVGSAIWTIMLVAMLPTYPRSPNWLVLVSLIYPLLYFVASLICDYQSRSDAAPKQEYR